MTRLHQKKGIIFILKIDKLSGYFPEWDTKSESLVISQVICLSNPTSVSKSDQLLALIWHVEKGKGHAIILKNNNKQSERNLESSTGRSILWAIYNSWNYPSHFIHHTR